MKSTLFFLISLSAAIFCSSSHRAIAAEITSPQKEWDESHDGVVLKELLARGFIKEAITKKKAVIVTDQKMGSKTSRLLFLKTADGSSYVVKENIGYTDEYKREKTLLKNKMVAQWKLIISEYSQKHAIKLPILVDYHATFKIDIQGTSTYITLMSKAKGESLEDVGNRLKSKNSGLTEEEAIDLGKEIGSQMGALTRAFFLKNGTILIHGDTNQNNFFYDSKQKQLYWIDLGGTREFPYRAGANTYEYPYQSETFTPQEGNFIKAMWWNFFPFQQKGDFEYLWDSINYQRLPGLTEEYKLHGIDVLKPHRLGILAGNAFYENYVNQVKTLEPAQEWNANRDSFPYSIEDQTLDYKIAVMKGFGGDERKKVLAYLNIKSPF